MHIYDCFIYNNEELVLDLRFNILDKYVDKFIIVESNFLHNGEKKRLTFNINKYQKFKKKIHYFVCKNDPSLKLSFSKDTPETDINIHKSVCRENFQRNFISQGLKTCKDNDIIIISDVDEIPNLSNIRFNNISNKIVFFEQFFFYYKLNLYNPGSLWYGSRLCRFKDLVSPQWLRNIKAKKYPCWRPDIFFSKRKYNNISIIKNGGWHFSYVMSPEDIYKKLNTYLHHVEIEEAKINIKDIAKKIKKKKIIYDLLLDKRSANKLNSKKKLTYFDFQKLPEFLKINYSKYKNWIEK